jgi:hypothetical protein
MNNLKDEQVVEIENKYWADMWKDLESLKTDARFKRLILEGYFKDKAVNGVSLLAQHAIVSGGHRSSVMEDLIAISKLEDFFITIENLGALPSEEDED